MNVKPGDLARVVAPFVMSGRGAVVRVVRPSHGKEPLGDTVFEGSSRASWVCEGYVRWENNRLHGPLIAIEDRCLRPLPGLDATEEASNALPNVMAPRRRVEFSR
jgi:hypothetical protein